MIFPKVIDLTPSGRIVYKARIGTKGYAENIEYQIKINTSGDLVSIDYVGEDNTRLSAVCPNFVEQIKKMTGHG